MAKVKILELFQIVRVGTVLVLKLFSVSFFQGGNSSDLKLFSLNIVTG